MPVSTVLINSTVGVVNGYG